MAGPPWAPGCWRRRGSGPQWPAGCPRWTAGPRSAGTRLCSSPPAEADRAWAKIFPRLPASVRFSFTKTSYPFRQPAFSALVRALGQYGTADYLPKITAPALVTQYQGETAFPGQGAAAERLIRSPATLHEFTAAAGCQFHCAPMAPQRRNQVLFDWLGRVL